VGFQSLRLYQFRNLEDTNLDLSGNQVFFIGENGQGKSNLLEALYLLSYGGSFRTRRDSEMCRDNSDSFGLDGQYTSNAEDVRVSLRFQEGKKTISLDGETIRDRRDLVSRIPTVIFRHDDMNFVQGSPDMQRWFIDQTLSMYQPVYIDMLRRYKAILRNRNQIIRDHGDPGLLKVYDRQLAETGLQLQGQREAVMAAFNIVFSEEFAWISQLPEPFVLRYRPSWRGLTNVDQVLRYLEDRRDQEMALRTTTSGPHRDRVLFRYGDLDFLQRGSTGQIRLVSLILRVAQARFFAEQTNRLPLLLLDDVLLELDPHRRARFVARLPRSEQRIFTFLPGEPWQDYQEENTIRYTVENGRCIGKKRS
jgi:DNA replication and repair protein RecF